MENRNGEHGNRYKMFRNFMNNELGITREDIKLWAQEALKECVAKLVGQIDVTGLVRDRVTVEVASIIRQSLSRADLGCLLDRFGYDVRIEKRPSQKEEEQ
jgi:hypothetical protein